MRVARTAAPFDCRIDPYIDLCSLHIHTRIAVTLPWLADLVQCLSGHVTPHGVRLNSQLKKDDIDESSDVSLHAVASLCWPRNRARDRPEGSFVCVFRGGI